MSKYNQYQTFDDKQPLLADDAPPTNNQQPPADDPQKAATHSAPPPPPPPPTPSKCCGVCLLFLTNIIAILAIIGLFNSLNTAPDYVFYPYIQLNSFSVTGFNQTNQISGDWDFDFSAANFNIRDKMSFRVSHIMVSLLHKNQEIPIWVTPVPSFDLDPKSVKTHIPGKFSGTSEILNMPAAKAIAYGIKTNGNVRFDMTFESYIAYESEKGLLTALCKDVDVFISRDTRRGRMSSNTADCRVRFTKNY